MKKILITFCFLFFLFSFAPAFAKGESDAASTIQKEDIQNLIGTLKDDASRGKLIADLEILLNHQEEQKTDEITDILDSAPALTEALGLRESAKEIVSAYENFLNKNAISSSLLHRSIGTFFTLLVFGGLFLGVGKLSYTVIKALDNLSNNVGVKLSRVTLYTKALRAILKILICGLVVYTLGEIWTVKSISRLFESDSMRGFMSTSATVLFVVVMAAFVWEAVGIYLSYMLKQASDNNQTRVKTLLPILRNIILVVFGLLFGLVLLSELGINVAPLLAGAGVIGVAIGFGAQSMVKDFLTGFTIVIEDIIRVGDVASVSGCTGVVEKITIRKLQMRDFAGIVYTIPFSQITTIQNLTKDYSYYVMDVGVSYAQNTDEAVAVMKEVDAELRHDPDFSALILEPIEIVGVERFDDSAVIIRARIKTRPIKQWDVGREFNRRMKMAFDKKGIEIPFQQRVITIRNEV
jgi:small conductance mechanosensitive channel